MPKRRSCTWAPRQPANVLQQQRNLAMAEDNLIAAKPAMPRTARASTRCWPRRLQHYGINLGEAHQRQRDRPRR